MPKLTKITTNFTSGELDPEAFGRVDIQRYENGAAELENVLVSVRGGIIRRPGFRFVAAGKHADKKGRMVPFIFSQTEAYMLEVGDQYIRFFKDNVALGAPYEIATPFTEAMLPQLRYVQGADTMFIQHSSMLTRRLRRFGDTNWVLDTVPFDVEPFDEIGASFNATLTLSAASVGTGRTCTASAAIFLTGDVGRPIFYLGGHARITGFTSSTVVTVEILTAFDSVNVPANVWTLGGSPQGIVTPSAAEPLEGAVTLTETTSGTPLNIWRSSDVGKFVRINGGLVEIESFSSATVVNGRIKQVLAAAAAAPANAWSLEASVWGGANGFPRAVGLHQQRLVLGGSPAFPQTVWGSAIGGYFDFTLGAFDDDAFAYTLASDQHNPVLHLASYKVLWALGHGQEFTLRGGVEKPITPTNIQADAESDFGASDVRPLRVARDILMVPQGGDQLLALTWVPDGEADEEDLSWLAEHVTRPGIVEITYQHRPHRTVWVVRADGVAGALTFSRKHEVVAWARAVTDGAIESMATIPVAGGQQTWAYVRRTVGGVAKRFIERLDTATNLDSCIVATAASPGQETWGGLTHLIGKTVQAIADGNYMGTFVVNGSGQITLQRKALAVQIGLAYSNHAKLLTPEAQIAEGTAQGSAMSTFEVVIRVHETYACKVNGQDMKFQKFGSELLDKPQVAVSGPKKVPTPISGGWKNGESDITISNDRPFPWHVLSVVRKWSVNSG